jgi:hypothetical protein
MRLGIRPERIRPAHPEENGQHERMHRTLKAATTRPARANLLQQQAAFDDFRAEFNAHRPHEALGMKVPATLYQASSRPYPDPVAEPTYPLHDDVLVVHADGKVRIGRKLCFITKALAGQPIGIREELDGRYLVTFMDRDLGHFNASHEFTPATPVPPEDKQTV